MRPKGHIHGMAASPVQSTLDGGDAPTVEAVLAEAEPAQRELLAGVRRSLRELPDVSEGLVYDRQSRIWAPTFYLGLEELCHLRWGRNAAVTVPIRSRSELPVLLQAREVRDDLLAIVEVARDYGGVRWPSFVVRDGEDVAAVVDLIGVRAQLLRGIDPRNATLDQWTRP